MADSLSLLGVDHVGVVVRDLAAATAFFERVLGLATSGMIEREDLTARFFDCHGVQIEILEISDGEQATDRLGDAPGRIDHVALSVSSVEATIAFLSGFGVNLREPRHSAGRVGVFADESTTGGIRLQFVEHTPRG